MVFFDEADRERVKFRLLSALKALTFSDEKVTDIQKNCDQKIEASEGLLLDLKATVAICSIAAFYLNADLLCDLSRVGVDADQVVSFIMWRRFIGQDVPPHEVALNEELCSMRNHRQPENLSGFLHSFGKPIILRY